MQNNDIQVYTVGVGAGVDQTELKGIASSPDTRYFYRADTYDSAAALSAIIGPKICNGEQKLRHTKVLQRQINMNTDIQKKKNNHIHTEELFSYMILNSINQK